MDLSGVILFTIVSILQGCTILGEGTQQPTHNYVLNSLYSDETQPAAMGDLRDIGILVGTVRIALYLDRSDIVIRHSMKFHERGNPYE